jgi:hypothetical protein
MLGMHKKSFTGNKKHCELGYSGHIPRSPKNKTKHKVPVERLLAVGGSLTADMPLGLVNFGAWMAPRWKRLLVAA